MYSQVRNLFALSNEKCSCFCLFVGCLKRHTVLQKKGWAKNRNHTSFLTASYLHTMPYLRSVFESKVNSEVERVDYGEWKHELCEAGHDDVGDLPSTLPRVLAHEDVGQVHGRRELDERLDLKQLSTVSRYVKVIVPVGALKRVFGFFHRYIFTLGRS